MTVVISVTKFTYKDYIKPSRVNRMAFLFTAVMFIFIV